MVTSKNVNPGVLEFGSVNGDVCVAFESEFSLVIVKRGVLNSETVG